jgi:hypothetical protein
MKKLFGCFAAGCLVVGIATPASAQLPGATVGLKVGLNVSDLSGDEGGTDLGFSSRTALAIGAAVAINVNPVFAFQPEVLFSQKGATDSDAGVDFALEIAYIDVPLLAKFSVPTPSSIRPVFLIGPVISFEASCNVSVEGGGVSASDSCDDALIPPRKSTDIGILGGAGLEIDVGPVILTFDGRYNLGLVNIDDSGDDDTSVKNRTVTGLVGVALKLPT